MNFRHVNQIILKAGTCLCKLIHLFIFLINIIYINNCTHLTLLMDLVDEYK